MKTCSGKATCATGLRQIAHSHLALLPRSSGRLSAAGKPQAHGKCRCCGLRVDIQRFADIQMNPMRGSSSGAPDVLLHAP